MKYRQTMMIFSTICMLMFIDTTVTVNASILNTLLGVPNECFHQTGVWPCKLSFSCWLQGGVHSRGCGNSKWLFSCCVLNTKAVTPVDVVTENNDGESGQFIPNTLMLKRRNDKEFVSKVQCGVPRSMQSDFQKRIIGGRPAYFAEYPWQAHIRISEFQCGGVLLSNNIIATAAHCIHQAELHDISVLLGELDTQNIGQIQEPLPVEKHKVVEKIIHPKFDCKMTQPDRFDIALLKLSKPTKFSDHILPICLPQHSIELTGRKGLIAGWGKTEPNFGIMGTNLLQVATVQIISSTECIQWHQSKKINVQLFNEMFCAGHPDGRQDACLGDSGGPLIIKEHDRFILVGITSAGFGCGVDHQPGIYHNIQKTAKWIKYIIRRNSF